MNGNRETKKGRKKKRKPNKYYGIYFLGFVISLYIVLSFFEPENTKKSLIASAYLLIQIAPILLLVVFFMGIMNYFLNPKTIKKYVGKGSGIRGWALAISTGILSHGPIYVWYPLLKDLRDHGMKNGLVAVFLYNRAIKIPLLPLFIYYFGAIFVAVLLIFMVIASIVEGKIIEKIEI